MKTFLIILAVIVILVLGFFGYRSLYKSYPAPATSSTAAVSTDQITMKNFAFSPNNVTVAAGQEVTFTNNDSVTHNIVANDGTFTSGNLAPGKTFKKTFSTANTVSYHCSIHPSMTGQIVVK